MSNLQIFREALESLAANKLRSTLTVLGIVIGVAAVIAMLAIGRGAQASIDSQINSLGSNLIYVSAGAQDVRNPRPLTMADAAAIQNSDQAGAIAQAAPVLTGRVRVSQRGESIYTTGYGVTQAYAEMRAYEVSEGQLINATQVRLRSAVAVIGTDVAKSVFGRTENLIGETIRVENLPFRIIGVLESKGGSSFGSEDDQILIPITTSQSRLMRRTIKDELDMILVQSTSAEMAELAVTQVTNILANRHKVSVDKPDFTIISQQSILETVQSITGILTIFLGGIGGISLLVGGIGIMNIMLVTVSERTREIGLRKALGARKGHIMAQFLAESSLLSVFGGAIGIGVAWLLSYIVAQFAASSDVEFTPLITVDVILLATLFSAAVGMFFGFYPARRAANLQPVEALRYE